MLKGQPTASHLAVLFLSKEPSKKLPGGSIILETGLREAELPCGQFLTLVALSQPSFHPQESWEANLAEVEKI